MLLPATYYPVSVFCVPFPIPCPYPLSPTVCATLAATKPKVLRLKKAKIHWPKAKSQDLRSKIRYGSRSPVPQGKATISLALDAVTFC